MITIDKNQLEQFLPQKAPFIMIDSLEISRTDNFSSTYTICADSIFLSKGELTEFALIENIAQTCAAGLAASQSLPSSQNTVGYMGGISKLAIYQLPRLHDTIRTHVQVLQTFGKLFLIKGLIELDENPLIECEMKIAAG